MSQASVDAELVKRVQAGDRQAFDILVLKYQTKVVSLISRYVKNPQDALDVAQEAFIKAYRALARFRGESAFYTWLYRIAINTAKNHLVAIGRRPPSSDIDATDAEHLSVGVVLHDIATPENQLAEMEMAALLQETIQALPEDLRTALLLRELDGLSYEAIAHTMDCPIGTVRSRIFRARDVIDKQLKPLREAD